MVIVYKNPGSETHQPFSTIQKYLNKPEYKNLCVEFVRYTMYILLHIATIQKVLIARFIAKYIEILFARWRFTGSFTDYRD